MNENSSLTLSDRLKSVIEAYIRPYGRYSSLAEKTNIGPESWKSFWHNRQRPTVEMVEVVCSIWPQHAFWVATGRADSANGHTSPGGFAAPEIKRASVMLLNG